MKTIRWALVLVLVAANARSDETANMVSSGAPASRAAIGTESGDTWTGNDADNPLYCELTSAPTLDFDTTGLATSAKQDTGNTTLSTISGKLPAALDGSGYLKTHEQGVATTSPQWCSVAAVLSSPTQLTANTDNQSVSPGCTGACQKLTCVNYDATDIVSVRQSSGGTGEVALLPGGSVEFSGATNCYFDSSHAPASTTATVYVGAIGCDP